VLALSKHKIRVAVLMSFNRRKVIVMLNAISKSTVKWILGVWIVINLFFLGAFSERKTFAVSCGYKLSADTGECASSLSQSCAMDCHALIVANNTYQASGVKYFGNAKYNWEIEGSQPLGGYVYVNCNQETACTYVTGANVACSRVSSDGGVTWGAGYCDASEASATACYTISETVVGDPVTKLSFYMGTCKESG
jgi:hypothetical protein